MQARDELPTLAASGNPSLRRLGPHASRFVVVAMLLLLHFAAFRGVTDVWARAFLIAHLGLILLWQPFVRSEQRVSPAQAALIAAVAVGVMLRLDWWMLVFWVVLLAGIVGGKVYQQQARWQRRFYLLVFAYLLALLFVALLPEVAPRREITPEVRAFAEYVLPVLIGAMAVLPTEPEPADAPQVIDFFYTVFLVLVLGVVTLGAFTMMAIGRLSYLEGLIETVFLMAGAVLVVGLLWNPREGYAGLNVFVSRYVFSIGVPLERWLYFLADLLRTEPRPERFLAQAVGGLARLPWVSGARWRTGTEGGETGEPSPHRVDLSSLGMELTIYSRYRTSPMLQWHLTLLAQLLTEFYRAKEREEQLRQQSYVQAVHETGARMTHDVKNLLQSLNVLCSVALGPDGESTPEQNALLRRQLPAIAKRLEETLEKLQRPARAGEETVDASDWWAALSRQYRSAGVEFAERGTTLGRTLPLAMVDSVADNLLQNALAKLAADPSVRVRAELACADSVEIRIVDSGRAVEPDVARALFQGPLASRSGGLGIGLYHAARHANAHGFRLSLERNRDGDVCFLLAGPGRQAVAAAGRDARDVAG